MSAGKASFSHILHVVSTQLVQVFSRSLYYMWEFIVSKFITEYFPSDLLDVKCLHFSLCSYCFSSVVFKSASISVIFSELWSLPILLIFASLLLLLSCPALLLPFPPIFSTIIILHYSHQSAICYSRNTSKYISPSKEVFSSKHRISYLRLFF